jgi:hypothetical protein
VITLKEETPTHRRFTLAGLTEREFAMIVYATRFVRPMQDKSQMEMRYFSAGLNALRAQNGIREL